MRRLLPGRYSATGLPISSRRVLAWTLLLILLGTALRAGMLGRDVRFHSDEALYSSFARRVSLHGDLLLSDAPLDKPPLAIAVEALSFSLFGVSEFAARLSAFFCSILTLAVTSALARRFYRPRVAWMALLLLSLSPYDLAFAATAFLDPMLTFWIVFACLLASRHRWAAAGTALALAIATKQTGLLFGPLVLLIGFACAPVTSWRVVLSRTVRFLIPIILGGLLLAGWSSARAAPVDFWTLGNINNTPGRFIRANELIPRLSLWLTYLGTIPGFGPLLVFAVIPLLWGASNRARVATACTLLIGVYVTATLVAFWLVAFNIYDRYLHTLCPLILLLVADGIVYCMARWRWAFGSLVLIIPFTVLALSGQLGIGGDNGQNKGIVDLATAIRNLPDRSTVYENNLDWELGFYLGDNSLARVIFVASPQSLTRITCGTAQPIYFAIRTSEVAQWLYSLRAADGYSGNTDLAEITHDKILFDGQFRLYRLRCAF